MKSLLRFLPFLLILGLMLAFCSTAMASEGEVVVDGNDLGAILGSSLSWQDKLGMFLTNPVVATILLILGIAGVTLEIATVGSFGAFGVLGGLSFLLYFMGSFWSGSFSALSIWLLLIGAVLLVLEIFCHPRFWYLRRCGHSFPVCLFDPGRTGSGLCRLVSAHRFGGLHRPDLVYDKK